MALSGQPQFVVADGKGKVYRNMTDKNEISEVDAESLKVLHSWPLAPVVGPSGLSVDRKNRRLFSAGRPDRVVSFEVTGWEAAND